LLLLPTILLGQVKVDVEATYGWSATDNESIIETALNTHSGTGDTLVFSGKEWTVDRINVYNKTDMVLWFEEGASLTANGNQDVNSPLVKMWGWQNITIWGNGLICSKPSLPGDTNEFGHFFSIASYYGGSNQASNIRIHNVKVISSSGDGILAHWTNGLYVYDSEFKNNWRQGVSITGTEGDVKFYNCLFDDTYQKAPKYGVDYEPEADDPLLGVTGFYDCEFKNNEGSGIGVASFHMNSADDDMTFEAINGYLQNNATDHPYASRKYEFFLNRSDQAGGGTNPVGGTINWEKIVVDGSVTGGYIHRSEAGVVGARTTTMKDIVLYDVSSLGDRPGLRFDATIHTNPVAAGNIDIDGMLVKMAGNDYVYSQIGDRFTNITGDIVGVSPFGLWLETDGPQTETNVTYTVEQNTSLPTTTVALAVEEQYAVEGGQRAKIVVSRTSAKIDYPTFVKLNVDSTNVKWGIDVPRIPHWIVIPKDSTTATLWVQAYDDDLIDAGEVDENLSFSIAPRNDLYTISGGSQTAVVTLTETTPNNVPVFKRKSPLSIAGTKSQIRYGSSSAYAFVGATQQSPGNYIINLNEKVSIPWMDSNTPGATAAANVDNTWSLVYVTNKGPDNVVGGLEDIMHSMTDKTIIGFQQSGWYDQGSINFEADHTDIIVAGQTAPPGGVHIMSDDFAGDRRIYWEDFESFQIRFIDIKGGWWMFVNEGAVRHAIWTTTRSRTAVIDHCSTGWASYAWNFSKIKNNDYINNKAGDFTMSHNFFVENARGHNTGHVTGIQMDYVRDNFANTTAAQEGAWAAQDPQLLYRNLYVGVSHRFPNTAGNPINVNADAINQYIYGPQFRLSRHTMGGLRINHTGNVYELADFSGDATWAAKETQDEINQFDNADSYNLGFSGAAGTPITPILDLHGSNNTFIDANGAISGTFSDYRDTYADFRGSGQWDYGAITWRPTYTPAYSLPIETNYTALKALLNENSGANVTINLDGTITRDDDTEAMYLGWLNGGAEPTLISSTNGDGGITDPNRMDAIPADWEAGAQSWNLATYDSDLDLMADAWEAEHGITDPFGVKSVWTFTEGDTTITVNNNCNYTNIQMFLFYKAGDFSKWYIDNGYYSQ